LRVLQRYKDGTLSIDAVKAEIGRLFKGHPMLLEQFSIFLPSAGGDRPKKVWQKSPETCKRALKHAKEP